MFLLKKAFQLVAFLPDRLGQYPLTRSRRRFDASRDCVLQFLNTDGSTADGWDYSHAQFRRQFADVNLQSITFGDIHHIERDNDWDAIVDYLTDEVKVAFKIAGIDNTNNDLGEGSVIDATEENVSRDFFVR